MLAHRGLFLGNEKQRKIVHSPNAVELGLIGFANFALKQQRRLNGSFHNFLFAVFQTPRHKHLWVSIKISQ